MGPGLWQLSRSGSHGAGIVHWEGRGATLAQVGQKREKLVEGEGLVSSGIFHLPLPPSPQTG